MNRAIKNRFALRDSPRMGKMRLYVYLAFTLYIIPLCQGESLPFACPPHPHLKTLFYQNWRDGTPFAEITVMEQFYEARIPPPPGQPQISDMTTVIRTVVRVDKVYTGCPPVTPYYALLAESPVQMVGEDTLFQKSRRYVLPMPLRSTSGLQKTLTVDYCHSYVRDLEHLSTEEKDFLNARISCCGGSCTCLGEGRVLQDCGQAACSSQAPCSEAQICRRNQCGYCAEEWYTAEWQIPCDK